MVMSWVWTGILTVSILCAFLNEQSGALASGILQGAQSGITLSLSLAGSICLWTGVGKLMEHAGITPFLSRCMMPLLKKVFPSSQKNEALRNALSGNICANFLGLGNAATPMGIQAAKLMIQPNNPKLATDEMCRLIVLNTASIQLIPANVAAIRASLGCKSPFDILPAVWITSICSAGLGLLAAFVLGRLWKHD